MGAPFELMHLPYARRYVDVQGVTIGKGFQGGMKRWGFHGGPASHGASLSHRILGATGQRQDPGRVFRGKKMPGHMGVETRTMQSLRVFKLDLRDNLIYVRGWIVPYAYPSGAYACPVVPIVLRSCVQLARCAPQVRGSVPGHDGAVVRVRDAWRVPFKKAASPPFPTYARRAFAYAVPYGRPFDICISCMGAHSTCASSHSRADVHFPYGRPFDCYASRDRV